jgi:hypothetical protein
MKERKWKIIEKKPTFHAKNHKFLIHKNEKLILKQSIHGFQKSI